MSFINKPGKNSAWRKRVLNNLVADIILYGKIETNLSIAKKYLRSLISKLIGYAKKANIDPKNKQHFYRLSLRHLVNKKNNKSKQEKKLTSELFDELGKRYKDRKGGYSRISRLKFRRGDNSKRVIFSLV